MSNDFLWQLVAHAATVAAAYAAIRADLAALHERTKNHADQIRDLYNKVNK